MIRSGCATERMRRTISSIRLWSRVVVAYSQFDLALRPDAELTEEFPCRTSIERRHVIGRLLVSCFDGVRHQFIKRGELLWEWDSIDAEQLPEDGKAMRPLVDHRASGEHGLQKHLRCLLEMEAHHRVGHLGPIEQEPECDFMIGRSVE
jgi:hypothetical protein